MQITVPFFKAIGFLVLDKWKLFLYVLYALLEQTTTNCIFEDNSYTCTVLGLGFFILLLNFNFQVHSCVRPRDLHIMIKQEE